MAVVRKPRPLGAPRRDDGHRCREKPDHPVNVLPRFVSACIATSLLVAALINATPAAADPADDAYFAALQRHNVVFSDPESAVTAGHSVCYGLRHGQTPVTLTLSLASSSELSVHVASYIVGAAIASYCPEFSSHNNQQNP